MQRHILLSPVGTHSTRLIRTLECLVFKDRLSPLAGLQDPSLSLSEMPADSFCLVDNSVIEMEREGKAGGVVKKHSMKGEIEKKLRGEGG